MVNSLIRLVEAKFGDDPLKNPSLLSFCRHLWTAPFPKIHAFFISNNFISNARLELAKNQANAKQHPEAEL